MHIRNYSHKHITSAFVDGDDLFNMDGDYMLNKEGNLAYQFSMRDLQ